MEKQDWRPGARSLVVKLDQSIACKRHCGSVEPLAAVHQHCLAGDEIGMV